MTLKVNSEGLTELQESLVEEMFAPEHQTGKDNRRKAAVAAGYSPKTMLSKIFTPKVVEAIISRSAAEISIATPKAVKSLEDILDDPTSMGNRERLAAAAQILDRGGLAKVERIQHEIQTDAPIFILPPKKTELPSEDND